jgi:putative ABC transport system substrate-binding protein
MRRSKPASIVSGASFPLMLASSAWQAFLDELRLNGFVEGQNLAIIPGGLNVGRDEIDTKVGSIVKAEPDAIVSGPDHYTRAVQVATQSIPIIAMSEDMVLDGLVSSLSRPSGNTTGISLLSPELDGKRQDLLIEAVPGIRRIATFLDATRTGQLHVKKLQTAAAARGIDVDVFSVSTPDQVLPAIDAAKKSSAGAINFLATPLFTINARPLLDRVVALRIPAMHQWPETPEEGGLIGYGPRFTGVFRKRARLVARVLRGAKPADIPVEQPTTFELAINVKIAKAIGHEIPAGLVLRADKVIE